MIALIVLLVLLAVLTALLAPEIEPYAARLRRLLFAEPCLGFSCQALHGHAAHATAAEPPPVAVRPVTMLLAAPDVPEHPVYGPLRDTPPGGITVVRDDGSAISIKADRHVQRKVTTDHAPTGPFAAVPYAPPSPSWAEPPRRRALTCGES